MKFDMGRAWSDAVALLSANRQVVLVVAGAFFFLPYLALMLLLPDSAAELQAAQRESGDPQVALQALSTFYGQIWWALLLVGVLQGIGMLGLMALLTDRARPTVGEALMIGAKFFLPYLGAQILMGIGAVLIVMVPLAVGAAAGGAAGLLVGLLAAVAVVYLWTKLSLTIPVIVIERVMNPVAALTRSWSLTKGNSLRLFGFYALLFLAALVLAIVLGIVIAVLTLLTGPTGSAVVNGIVNGLVNMAGVTLIMAVLAAIHRQLAGPSAAAVSETFG